MTRWKKITKNRVDKKFDRKANHVPQHCGHSFLPTNRGHVHAPSLSPALLKPQASRCTGRSRQRETEKIVSKKGYSSRPAGECLGFYKSDEQQINGKRHKGITRAVTGFIAMDMLPLTAKLRSLASNSFPPDPTALITLQFLTQLKLAVLDSHRKHHSSHLSCFYLKKVFILKEGG